MEIERLDPDAEAVAKLVKLLQSDDPTTSTDAYFQAGLWRGIVIGMLYVSFPPMVQVSDRERYVRETINPK